MEERATLSLSLVVKDEEASLKRCLDSVKGVVDEIVCLVDDSSTDRTYEIAKANADIVEYFKWENDFAKARNLSMSKCTKDWIMIMDGHEVLFPYSKTILHDLMQRVLPKRNLDDALFFSGYAYMLHDMPRNEEEMKSIIPEVFFLQPRIYRASEFGLKDGQLHYEGKSHNYIIGGNSELKKYPVKELVFLHARDDDNAQKRKAQRSSMNEKNLKADIEKTPEKPRPYFYLAQTYLDDGEKEKAVEYYQKYLNLDTSKWPDERAQAMLALATVKADKKEYEQAEIWGLKALSERWDRAEIYMVLGDMSLEQGRDTTKDIRDREKKIKQALHWYKCAAGMDPPFSSLFLHGPAYSYLPYERLCKVYDLVGNWAEAIDNGLKVLKFQPNYEKMANNISLWKSKMGINPDKNNMLVFARGDTFIKPVIQRIRDDYNVRLVDRYTPDDLKFCNKQNDTVFFEWCDVNIIEASNREKPKGQKWIVRLHSYESYTNMPNSVDWSKVDYLIYVADHIKRKTEKRYPKIKEIPNTVIHNGVDTQQYSFAVRERGFNVGFVGIFSWKKGIQGLVMTLKHLVKKDPRFILHARIDFYEGDSTVRQAADYWDYKYADLKNNIRFYPKRESNLNGWLEDMNYVLSCSTIEAFSYYIAEAMCKGIKPLVYDWEGAKEVWPSELVWDSFEDLDKIIDGEYDSYKYRDYVVKNYSRESQMEQFKKVFKKVQEEQ